MNNITRVTKGESLLSGKVLVTCTVTIFGLGWHSGTGEEWADDDNGMTSADAQAFKRACSCFGLGRYFYDFQAVWVDLDQNRQPVRTPALFAWALPDNWRKGMRPSGRNRNGSGAGSSNCTNGISQATGSNTARVSGNGHTDAGNTKAGATGWDMALRYPMGPPLTGHTDAVLSVAFGPDGKTLASSSIDKTVRLWDVDGRGTLSEPLAAQDSSIVSTVTFRRDGKILASASLGGMVQLWDVARRQPLGPPLLSHSSPVNSVIFSPDGKTLAWGSGDFTGNDNTVRLWDVASRQPFGQPLKGHRAAVSSVTFSPNGRTLASASWDGTVRLWDVASGQPLGQPLMGHSSSVDSVAFSPDGKTLASGIRDMTGNDYAVQLWDVATGKPRRGPLGRHSGLVTSVAFSPDGKALASASDDNTVRLWDVANRKPLAEPLQGHSSVAWSVAFSPDGKTLASGSGDNAVRLWDVATQQPFGGPFMDSGVVKCVAFSPDGKTLASGGSDYVRLWDLDPNSWAARACARANRNLSQAEWEHYIGKNVPYHRTCPNLPPGEGVPAK